MCGSFSKNPSSASLTLTFEEMREVFRACGLKGKSIPALFLLMDKSHSGHITASEFLSLFDLLALNLEVVQSEQATPMAKRYPHLRKMVHAGWFLILTDIVIFCSAFIIIRELIVEGKFQQSTFSRFLDISFLTFSMIEVGLRLLIGGLHTPRDVWLKFDSVVVVTMCLAELFMVFEQISFVRLTIILRVMRLVRPMSMLPEFRVVTRTLASIVPRIGVVAAILMTAFYVYGQLGMFLYHGTIVKDDPRLEGSDFAKNNYWLLNFDDFYNTLVTLYCVMLTNNWFVIMNAYATVTSEWATVYFTVWVLFTMQVALNLLIGFVVDTYQYENERVKNSPTFEVFMTKEGSPSHIRRVYEERTSEEVKKLEAEMEENGESYFSISLKSFMTGDDWLRDMFMRDVFQVLDPDDWEAAKFSNLRSHASADNRTTRHSHTDVLSGTDGGPSENDPQVDASVVRRVNSESTIV
ncbi:hypothetical protein, variant [Sphaeroforma arctica JP610]|nr:hypothetical protein, variant [Sphaeroforma arctica JP610]KNC80568.1 hypothetical protein, variant [Sphaeroforma arctica JP610]|eukprot:XP_014154470.1 hypothetical protein, variant [Sphaeroforma arctica JP610]